MMNNMFFFLRSIPILKSPEIRLVIFDRCKHALLETTSIFKLFQPRLADFFQTWSISNLKYIFFLKNIEELGTSHCVFLNQLVIVIINNVTFGIQHISSRICCPNVWRPWWSRNAILAGKHQGPEPKSGAFLEQWILLMSNTFVKCSP